jgi:hypothetical protein
MNSGSIDTYVITDHAAFEIKRRNISREIIKQILSHPEQLITAGKGRHIFQSRIQVEDGRYLFRIIVDVDQKPAEVVTAYRTSKIEKYWGKIS